MRLCLPDIGGAYFKGASAALPADAPFPLSRDVEVVVVLTEGERDDNLEILHRGVIAAL